ncbi:MAG: EAL domain-containing protein [Cyanobacteria bacterium P01_B01_bin.77]
MNYVILAIHFAISRLIDRVLSSVGAHWPALNLGSEIHGTIDQAALSLAVGSLIVGLIAVVLQNHYLLREITRRQKAEAELEASEAHYRALIQALPDLIIRINRYGICLEYLASPNFPILGDVSLNWVGSHVTDRLPPDLAQQRLEAIHTALETQCIQIYEQDLSVNGRIQMEQVRVVPYSSDEALILVQNISDRKRAEEKLRVSEQRFRRAIAMAPLPIMLHAEDGEVLHINGTWTELTGYTQQDIPTTQTWAELAYGNQADTILKTIIAQKYSSETRQDEGDLAITTRTGHQLIWEFSSSVLEKLPDGRQVAISMAMDVTERRQAEKALRESEESYRSIYNQAAVGLVNGTIDLKFIDVNPRFCEMLGYSREDLLAKSVTDLTHPDDWSQSKSVVQRLFLNETPYISQKKRYLRKDGSSLWCNTGISIVRDVEGNPKHTLTVIHDISEQVKAEEQLKYDAFHDELTGLPNRSLLMKRLELALKRTKRYPEAQLAVLFIDLDNFKVINDSLGHLVGDELLLAIANKLELIIRDTDLAARLGGDEFVVLLEEIIDLSEAILVTERILEVLQSPLKIGGRELFPSASIGIVTSSTASYHQAAELLRDADVAMYCAKQSGYGQYVIFTPTMHLQAVQRLRLEHDLRKALDNHEFLLYYQPVVNLNNQTVEAFEALVRWQHPQVGSLSLNQFSEIAEETGLISFISEWMLQMACQQLATWQTQFPQQSLSLHVSLSGQLLDDSMLTKLKDILTIHQLPANSLILEIPESALLKTMETTQRVFHRLQTHGIQIAIDDFGTGYSCLRYLHQLPINTLKIDRSFISPEDPHSHSHSQVITESILTLCNSLGLQAIAQGIETRQQLSWLRDIGYTVGQGKYFSEPVPVEQATKFLQQESLKGLA